MTAVDPSGQVHITIVEGDRLVQVVRKKKSQSLRTYINERAFKVGGYCDKDCLESYQPKQTDGKRGFQAYCMCHD